MDIEVSQNRGTPKSSILFSDFPRNRPPRYFGTPIFVEIPQPHPSFSSFTPMKVSGLSIWIGCSWIFDYKPAMFHGTPQRGYLHLWKPPYMTIYSSSRSISTYKNHKQPQSSTWIGFSWIFHSKPAMFHGTPHGSTIFLHFFRQGLRQVAQAQSQVAQVAQAQPVQAAQEPFTAEARKWWESFQMGKMDTLDMFISDIYIYLYIYMVTPQIRYFYWKYRQKLCFGRF